MANSKGKQRQRDEEAQTQAERTPLLSGQAVSRPGQSAAAPPAASASSRGATKRMLFRAVALASALAAAFYVVTAWRQAILDRRPPSSKHRQPPPFPDPSLRDGHTPAERNPAYLVRGRHGAVATEVNICSDVGVDVLKDGGNAVDAAVASCLCVGAVNSFASGIGGGGFLVFRPANISQQQPVAIDFRETAPTGSHPDMYRNDKISSIWGAKAIGVPGELRGLEAAFENFGSGKVSWERLFEPSIKLAENQTVGPEVARRLTIPFFADFMRDDPLWASIFMKQGQYLVEGDEVRRPAFAETLKTIAKHGADAFYHGEIAKAMIKTVQEAGGLLTLDDLAAYQALITPALQGSYRNRTVWTTQAPTSGPVLLSLLNSLETFDAFVEDGRSPLNVHRFIEAQKLAFAARSALGDPAFTNTSAQWHDITTKSFGRSQARRITDDQTHATAYYDPHFDIHEDHGTTHISVVDSEGAAVALTSTVNFIYGSRVMCPSTGVIFNDEMADFAAPGEPDPFGLAPSPFNYPEGPKIKGGMGKRSMSSTSASVMENEGGGFELAIGGSGGSRIFGSVAQVILNRDWGFDLSHAIEEPRVHHQLLPAQASVESGLSPEIVEGLQARGHNISMTDINFGLSEVQAVALEHDWFIGASDSRKHGKAAAW